MAQDTRNREFANRRAFIGGSDARIIMGDDEAALVRLWREKRGEIEPEDLTANLIVQLGTVTEHLNRHWYERNTGQVVTEVQRQVFHPVKRWMAATLDGMVEGTGAGQMGGNDHSIRSALPASAAHRREAVLALRGNGRSPSPVWRRA